MSRQTQSPLDVLKEGKSDDTPVCPKCGSEMRLRTARRGKNAGSQFWGCSTYPRCKGTRNVEASEPETKVGEAKEIHWSPFQTAIFDFIKGGQGNAVVEAVAGSGKTSTIVHGLGFTPTDAKVAFVAFNRHIAKELSRRAPEHVSVSTLHSLGFGNIRATLGRVKVEPYKVRNIVRDLAEAGSRSTYDVIRTNEKAIAQLVSLLKSTLLEVNAESMGYICDRYGIETNGAQDVVFETARRAFEKSARQTGIIDYDDMIWFCASGKVACEQFDILFIDEAQDLNKAQTAMALKSVKEDGRIIAVGDRNQSIYGFRGADTDAIPGLIEALDATTLPLSITYRCPQSHVRLAQVMVPEITAAEGAADGKVEYISLSQFSHTVAVEDLVLCRCNAPLVGPAFELIRRGVKAVILGRDIGKGLLALVYKVQKKSGAYDLNRTLYELGEYARREIAKLVALDKMNRVQLLEDKIETIIALSEGCSTIRQLEDRVHQVFTDEQGGVTFSSVHKAKGAEAERVFILEPQLMPHPRAEQPWEQAQEQNIKYVAYTRSKSELYFVG